MNARRFFPITAMIIILVLSAGSAFASTIDASVEPYSCIELCGMRDEQELEDFLLTAEVGSIEDVGEGITAPRRVVLQKDGKECRAIFKTVDITSSDPGYTNRLEMVFTDKYVYEAAAYRLDRLLGIGLVPVTVIREIDGELGSLQYWIENTVKMQDAADNNLMVGNVDLLMQRFMLTYILDAMIYNIDRNFTNILVRPGEDDFFLIDHSRAFRTLKKLPSLKEERNIPVPERVASGLRGLDLEALHSELDELLSRRQIKAIDRRRQLLLNELDALGVLPAVG